MSPFAGDGSPRSGAALPWPATAAGRAAASVLSRSDVRMLDSATIAAGTAALELMERAGAAIAQALVQRRGLPRGGCSGSERPRLLVLAGSGNNGGDGLVVARLLTRMHWLCTVALCAGEPRGDGEAAVNLQRWQSMGGRVIDLHAARAMLAAETPPFDVVLDALLGTGLERPVESSLADIIHHINCEPSGRRPFDVVAVDIPSGLDADSGRPLGVAVRADATVALGAYKPGLFVGCGPDYAGRLLGADIGLLAPSHAGLQALGLALDRRSTAGALAPPSPLAHKGSRGHVLVIAGSRGKSGAAVLCARAALRSGAGLVTLALPESQQAIAAASLAEVMTASLPEDKTGAFAEACSETMQALIESADSVVFGPGVGTGKGAAAVLRVVLAAARGPVVLDADALNLLAAAGAERRGMLADRVSRGLGQVVLTPHPGEMARLVAKTTAEVQAARLEMAVNLAKSEGCVVVIKGAGTIVTDGSRTAFNTSGNAGMACAGMGDVLAGVVAALAARCEHTLDAACLAVYAHGVAGDLCAYGSSEEADSNGGTGRAPSAQWPRLARSRVEAGFLAGEVADALPAALGRICA